jgi:hypothetical protein
LAIFVAGRIGNLSAGYGFIGSMAWAQESEDQAAEAASPDDTASQPDSASQDDADSTKTAPVSASGVYSGTVMDSKMGAGTISAAITQIRGQLSGTWQDTFVPPAFLKGTITAKGKISLAMRFHLTGNCGYIFAGVFENGNEISGNYKLNGCKGSAPDHGTLDMTKQ